MRILGIDYGDARVGLAISDPFGWTAQGLDTVHYKGNNKMLFENIANVVKQYQVEKIVVGFPKNMNGTIGPRGEKTEAFIEELASKFSIPVIKWDERLTSVAANRTMHETGLKTSKKKDTVDKLAAVYILQGFLGTGGNAVK